MICPRKFRMLQSEDVVLSSLRNVSMMLAPCNLAVDPGVCMILPRVSYTNAVLTGGSSTVQGMDLDDSICPSSLTLITRLVVGFTSYVEARGVQ
ncbi:hypothetical protein BOTNAR_1609g00020 [Botryotinia narcissicola]|uniref:Uncharacterized protein n=1 Tax=Botryotinia narcissicola TaxID=278944 RepID=A0A4Z1H4D6_9HELO|nr:hypothetical protein BOTNAR_1609g00020 [Botryotinia narcissicola]